MTHEKSARMRRAYQAHDKSTFSALDDCYGKYSGEKAAAWNYCKHLCQEDNGFYLRIISFNTFMFTAGYITMEKGTDRPIFVLITPTKDLFAYCDELV